ncbi:MAG TPA: protein kinase [Vicinamibacterales bacterium]|nr:protein kinase [Vicinamibacterales bacterium]
MPLTAGTRLGVYEIIIALGAGGMGEVYRARDPKLKREVAVKVLPEEFAADPERLARFKREALAMAALSHPNLLAIHDFGDTEGRPYVVMELLEGRTLRERLTAGPLPVRKALDCALQIAKGLTAAHAKGIVHRDLKPANVFIGRDDHVKILDFGLAKQLPIGDSSQVETALDLEATKRGTVFGTPGYMSPEQVYGKHVDQRSDLFSFGCVMYEMLSGRRAFQGESAVDILHATLRDSPVNLSTLVDAPQPTIRLVSRCLEKGPEDRFQSARDLAFAIDGAIAAQGSRPSEAAAGDRKKPHWRRVALACVAAALLAASWWAIWAVRPETTPQPAVTSNAADAARGIAVLPFENIGAPAEAYFASGVSEEVTAQLSQISLFRVMSRTAVSRFPGGAKDLAEMHRQLGIAAALTGSVRHAGGRVRISVQLVSAPGGETLWSQQYDRAAGDVFAVQTDVALQVAQALQTALKIEEWARLQRLPTENAAAADLYFRSQRVRNAESIALLKQAVTLDPNFALAYAALARRYALGALGEHDPNLEQGVQAAKAALAIDPHLGRAHHALAANLEGLGRVDEARIEMSRAIDDDPSFQAAYTDLSIIEANAHHHDQSLYWARRAFPLGPNLWTSYYHVAAPLVWLDYSIAERYLLGAASRFPEAMRLQTLLAILDYLRGRPDAALERLRRALVVQPDNEETILVFTEVAALTESSDAEMLVDKLFQESPGARGWFSPHTARTFRAYYLMKSGRQAQALPLIQESLEANRKALEAGDRKPHLPLENVALHLMRGDLNAAHEWLDKADKAGWTDQSAARDPLLAPLRKDPKFVAFLARIGRDISAMRKRADLSGLDGAPTR